MVSNASRHLGSNVYDGVLLPISRKDFCLQEFVHEKSLREAQLLSSEIKLIPHWMFWPFEMMRDEHTMCHFVPIFNLDIAQQDTSFATKKWDKKVQRLLLTPEHKFRFVLVTIEFFSDPKSCEHPYSKYLFVWQELSRWNSGNALH